MATQRFYDGQPGPDIRRELNNFEAILDGTVAAAQDASTAATSASAKAQQWADAAPGVEVEAGKYSAKHWADRAQTTVTGGLIYRGSHSAASGAFPATPSLGDYYKISAAGTLGGVYYSVGDSIIYNGTDWDKIDSTDAVTSVAGRVGEVVLTKGDVGLGNVDNTSDANKPVSTATQTALDGKAAASHGHAIADVTGLQSALDGKESTIAAGTVTQYWRGDKTWSDFFTDVRAATLTGLSTATNAVITATDTVLSALGKLQKQVSDNLATLTSHTGNTSNPHGVTKVQVGLGNVDNTSDVNKPISSATQTALSAKFDKTGGDVDGNINFTGTGRRITGDFSNGTVASRVMFQTSTVNGNTVVSTLPNGSSTISGFRAYGSDNLLNGISADFIASIAAGDVRLISNAYGSGAYLPMAFYTGGSERMRIDTSGNVLVTNAAGIGYGVGAGGTVVQATSKSTAVTLNKPTGQITMNNAALAAGASVTFQLSNNLITTVDALILTIDAYSIIGIPTEKYSVSGSVLGSGAYITVKNISAGSLSEALRINFTIIKGATS